MNLERDIPLGEILRPNEKEFKDFKSYIYKLFTNPKYKDCGVLKIIPPFSQKLPIQKMKKIIKKLSVKNPILQELYGSNGVYKLKLISQKSLSLKEYKKKVEIEEKPIKKKSIQKIEDFVN